MCLNVFKKCAKIYFCLEQRMRIHRIEKGSFGKSNRNYIELFLFFFIFSFFLFHHLVCPITTVLLGLKKKNTVVQKRTGNAPVLLSST
jgi:hypothetical protein